MHISSGYFYLKRAELNLRLPRGVLKKLNASANAWGCGPESRKGGGMTDDDRYAYVEHAATEEGVEAI